ncbi:unnamed protein product [Adineta steineri]|uniref:GAIN-B domain-containing protein n=1 Tax=Adineta steineri TaxID=433720 RepID=A0A819F549_9BILA|nr:unnamed protein product [Adineta steineri]
MITGTSMTSQAPTTMYPTGYCMNGTHIILNNGTCVSRADEQAYLVSIILGNSSNSTVKSDALQSYLNIITNSTVPSNSNNTLSIGQINQVLGSLTSDNYTNANGNSIILLTQPGTNLTNKTIIGISYAPIRNDTIVNTANKDNVTDRIQQVIGIMELGSLNGATSFNMLLINNPSSFQNQDNSSSAIQVVSSIVIATVNTANYVNNLNIGLYFQVLQFYGAGTHMCAFYNTTTSQWDNAGCSPAVYNPMFNRYECNCNHLTSFALIWLPPSSNSIDSQWDIQDTISIVVEVLSIACFIGVLIHMNLNCNKDSMDYTQKRSVLPLISIGITMILFIFYIALGLTVYFGRRSSNTSNSQQNNPDGRSLDVLSPRIISPTGISNNTFTPCEPVELGLMNIVYFLIIFMFGVKTSVAYFNYKHFVQLFPPPNRRYLFIALGISALIGIIFMSCAAGINNNSSHKIIQIYLNKICWFTHDVIHYFLTIPICIFLALNIISIILVARHEIKSSTDEKSQIRHRRRKYCVIFLLISCLTQGLSWAFGFLITNLDAEGADIAGWFFVIFNGLEGVWAILLYCIIRKEKIDEDEGREERRKDDDRPAEYVALHDLSNHRLDSSIDNQNDETISRQLTALRSDPLRNSYADLDEIHIQHRPRHGNKDNLDELNMHHRPRHGNSDDQ